MQTTSPSQRPLYQNHAAVRWHRARVGLKRRALADLVGIPEGHMSKIERGTASASVEVLHRIARALCWPVEELLADQG